MARKKATKKTPAKRKGIEWPADQVEPRKVSELVPYARNSRHHSDQQVDQIAQAIETFGWTTPILIDEQGTIIAGHGRIMAAHRLGLTEVPCMVARGWSEAQKRAYVIADNKIHDNSSWNEAELGAELADLDGLGFDLELTGFDIDEVAKLVADKPELEQKEEKLRPMSMTHVLISIPNSVGLDFLGEALKAVTDRGGRVDYGGN